MKFLIILLGLITACYAQPKEILTITKNCSTAELKKNLYALASDEMEGRMMASHGDTLAAIFTANWFKEQNLLAPFEGSKSYYQEITGEKVINTSQLTFDGRSYLPSEGWNLYPKATVELTALQVLFTNFDGIQQVLQTVKPEQAAGKALLLNTTAMVKMLSDNSIDSMEKLIIAMGFRAIIWYGPSVRRAVTMQKQRAFLPSYTVHLPGEATVTAGFPEIALTPELATEFFKGEGLTLDENGKLNDSTKGVFIFKKPISVSFSRTTQKVTAPNVIAVLKGSDTSLPVIVIGAHRDHDGKDGHLIYYGASDNASGTVSIMQIAAMMNAAVKKGYRPKRTIVFASFTGEERGLLGSSWYVDHPVYPLANTFAYVNIDMVGRVDTLHTQQKADSNYVYFLVNDKDSSNKILRNTLYESNKLLGQLALDTHFEDPKYRRRMFVGSDQYPFALKGIPFLDLTCGFYPEYHQPGDTPDKINYPLLTKQVQLAFLTLWSLASR